MPAELAPFSGDAPNCAKCRYTIASTKWIEPYRLGTTVLEAEHFRRACSRCGFTWREALISED